MSRTFACLTSIAVLAVVAPITRAEVIFESAPLADPLIGGTGGGAISYNSYVGTRFSVSSATQVTAVGGCLGAYQNNLFGAIVKLSGPTALPRMGGNIFNPTPFNSNDVVAHAVFAASYPSTDFRVNMSTTLTPGWYGLVFGSYQWGAYGDGFMPPSGQHVPGASFFSFTNGTWQDDPPAWAGRFVVEGVPEPAGSVVLGLGFMVMLRRRRRRCP